MKLAQLIESYIFAGNCVTSFENGCDFYNYTDVNDFAIGEENAVNVTKVTFLRHIQYDPIIDKCDIFMYDKDHDVYIAYDSEADIHYFFIKN